jgi:hypothetical protein
MIAGILGAAAFAFVSHKLERAPRTQEVARAEAETVAPASADVEAVVDRRLAEMAGRLAARAPEAAPPRAVEPAAPVARPTVEDRARLAEREAKDHEARLAEHDRETRDGAWAATMETRAADTFRGLPPDGAARFEGVDCRSHTCVATLSWPSYDGAVASLQDTAAVGARMGCAERLTLPAATGGDRYEAKLLFDCASSAR